MSNLKLLSKKNKFPNVYTLRNKKESKKQGSYVYKF